MPAQGHHNAQAEARRQRCRPGGLGLGDRPCLWEGQNVGRLLKPLLHQGGQRAFAAQQGSQLLMQLHLCQVLGLWQVLGVLAPSGFRQNHCEELSLRERCAQVLVLFFLLVGAIWRELGLPMQEGRSYPMMGRVSVFRREPALVSRLEVGSTHGGNLLLGQHCEDSL